MKPAPKSDKMDDVLTAMFGVNRTASIMDDRCVEPPIGCGKPIENFDRWSEMEKGEYKISGLCKTCQADIFK